MTIRVLIADDHELVRIGLSMMIDQVDEFEVVGLAEDGESALKLAAELLPDLVLMDIRMPGINGLDCLPTLHEIVPKARILILSMHRESDYVHQALQRGAHGYLVKDSSQGDLELAIRTVAAGNIWLSAKLLDSDEQGGGVHKAFSSTPAGPGDLSALTDRQIQVLTCLAEGKTIKEIAFELDLSAKTVESHRSQIMKRIDIHDVPTLVRFAIRNGLVNL